MERINRSHKNKDLSTHLKGKAKFVELEAEKAPVKDIGWDVQQGEVHSDIQLTEDKGVGEAAIVREFTFAVNPETWKQNPPTRQELFNAHAAQIEHMLMVDGLKVLDNVSPRVAISKNNKYYRIIVGARARIGWGVPEAPKTLTQIINPQ